MRGSLRYSVLSHALPGRPFPAKTAGDRSTGRVRGAPATIVHADAYRLGSRAEVDDLDLDADLGTAVTVVEWGEGLVEDLADSFLVVNIEPGAAPADTAEAAQGPRDVHIQGHGERWLGTDWPVLAAD